MASIAIVNRLAALVNNDTTFTVDDYNTMLADHAIEFDSPCQALNSPTFTRFDIGLSNLETTTQIYLRGSTTVLVETTAYTLDYQRGVFTTPTTDYRALSARGTSYNISLSAADAWERIASRYALEFDFSDVEGSYKRSQQYTQCMAMAAKYRRMAGARSVYVERGDMLGRPINIDRIATG